MVYLFVCSFICRQRVVIGHWLTGERMLLQTATRSRSDSGTPGQPVSQMFLPP